MAGILDLLLGVQGQQPQAGVNPIDEIQVQGTGAAANGAAVLAGMAPHGQQAAPAALPAAASQIMPVGLQRPMGGGSGSAPAAALPALGKAVAATSGDGGSNFLEKLMPLFLGMSQGRTAAESLGYGGYALTAAGEQRKLKAETKTAQNETATWLMGQGMGPAEAKYLATNKDALGAWHKSWTEGKKPEWQMVERPDAVYMVDKNNPDSFKKLDIAKMPEMTSDQKEYTLAKQQGFNGTFLDYQVKLKEAGRSTTSVSIDQKAESEFNKSLGTGMGKTFSGMYDEGVAAQQDLAKVDRLEGLLKQSGSGLGPALVNGAAGFGITLAPGAGPAQAASALIDSMVPSQRPAGSGSTSDADLKLFKNAVPKLLNTPEGNRLILETMRGVAQDKRARGDVAARVMSGDLDQKGALEAIRNLPDPFAVLKAAQSAGGTGRDVQPSRDELEAEARRRGLLK